MKQPTCGSWGVDYLHSDFPKASSPLFIDPTVRKLFLGYCLSPVNCSFQEIKNKVIIENKSTEPVLAPSKGSASFHRSLIG